MRFAISIPQVRSDGEFDPARFQAYMARAEALGFESAWTLESPIGSMPFLSPLQILSYAAACTVESAWAAPCSLPRCTARST
jgi:alkanesulfonate monooxygenase SsuD/methylene tetrahydromethanopterin reductase-like flavin-dependent oxidoreductase (luciferase family)